MRIIIFASLFAVAVGASLLEEKFQDFKHKYTKNYRNKVEEAQRFFNFKDTLRSIEQHNSLYEQDIVSYKQGVNRFADLTKVEIKAMLTLKASERPTSNTSKHIKTGLSIPDSVDWRAKGQVTGVKDQGICGSCWAFSIAASTEAAFARKTGKLVSLSEQQLIDCTVGLNHGCGGGLLEQTFPYIEQHGLESEDTYPFIGIDGFCHYNTSMVIAKVTDYKVIETNDEEALIDAVANIGPVSVGMDATFLPHYASGIFDEPKCSKEQLGHAVLIVGYGTENNMPFWIVKNSWGKTWGEQGYFRIKRGCNMCGIAKDTVYPMWN